MSLLNKNFSNPADSQVGVHCIAFEQSHLTCDEYNIFFTRKMGLSALSSQKVASDWNHKSLSFWFMYFKNISLKSGMIIFSERSFKYFFIQITVMNQAMIFSFWTLGRYLWYQNCSEGQIQRRLLTISACKWEYFFNSMLMTKLC